MNKVTMFQATPNKNVEILRASIQGTADELVPFWDGVGGSNYYPAGVFYTECFGVDAAEDAFDLSNNPSRYSHHLLVQGKQRTLSVGDVVLVEERSNTGNVTERFFMCLSIGWEEL